MRDYLEIVMLFFATTANLCYGYSNFFPVSLGDRIATIDFTMTMIRSNGELLYYLDKIDEDVRQLLLKIDPQYNLHISGTINSNQMKLEVICKMKISKESLKMSILIGKGVDIVCNGHPKEFMGYFDRNVSYIEGYPHYGMESERMLGYCRFGEVSSGARVGRLEAQLTNIVITGFKGHTYPFPDYDLTVTEDRVSVPLLSSTAVPYNCSSASFNVVPCHSYSTVPLTVVTVILAVWFIATVVAMVVATVPNRCRTWWRGKLSRLLGDCAAVVPVYSGIAYETARDAGPASVTVVPRGASGPGIVVMDVVQLMSRVQAATAATLDREGLGTHANSVWLAMRPAVLNGCEKEGLLASSDVTEPLRNFRSSLD